MQIEALNAIVRLDSQTEVPINYVEGYIQVIARNLIANALKYTSPDRTPELSITTRKTDEYFIIIFSDNGIGIDLKRQGNKLYQPFQRLSTVGKGLGIGLHIIHNMVRKNGGKILVESEPGSGTTFMVHLKEYKA